MRGANITAGLFLIVAAILCPGPAEGGLVIIAIEGVVDYVDDPFGLLGEDIKIGAAISGTYSYDSGTPDSNPFERYGTYWQYDPFGIMLDVGGHIFRSRHGDTKLLLEITNDNPHDDYFLRSYNNARLANGAPVDSISWHLLHRAGTALSSDSLLADAPALSQWEGNILTITGDRAYGIKGHVESVRVIPEPATVLLCALGAFPLLRK